MLPSNLESIKQSFLEIFFLIIYLFLADLGLHRYMQMQASSNCGEQGLLSVAGCGLLTAMASLVVEHRL